MTQATVSQRQARPIRVLSPLVAAQIAAGEVVERPASVVKELVENALDAGASRIVVEIEEGGVELVRVRDDGHGMSPEDLPLAVAAHATSKVSSAADLDRVTTMGFRGEALSSIASVSRLSIRTRRREEAGAWALDVEGDATGAVRPESGPAGTQVTVRTLFFNTPARRKFLKSTPTEHGHCVEAVRQIALAHPAVGFEVRAGGRSVLEVPAGQGPRDRVLALLGAELERELLEVHADEFDDARGAALWGMVGRPGASRSTTRWQSVFVNGRAIRDRSVAHALKEAYRGLIDPARHPAAVLMLEMDPGAVDVNVHPAKSEVRFRDPGLIHALVHRAVREALARADLTPAVPAARGAPTDLSVAPGAPGATRGAAFAGHAPVPMAPDPSADRSRFVEYFQRGAGAVGGSGGSAGFSFAALRAAIGEPQAGAVAAMESPAGGAPSLSATGDGRDAGGAQAHAPAMAVPEPVAPVMQVHNSYVVTQDSQGMVIIDQHALHERVMFEALRERLERGALESQRLLVPAVVDAPGGRGELVGALSGLLERLGIEARAIGPAQVAVESFPSFLFEKRVDPGVFVGELLERAQSEGWGERPGWAGDGRGAIESLLHEVLDMMACKAAVKAGDELSEAELRALLAQRERVERSSNCPHGRPTAIRLSIRDLEKWFGRS